MKHKYKLNLAHLGRSESTGSGCWWLPFLRTTLPLAYNHGCLPHTTPHTIHTQTVDNTSTITPRPPGSPPPCGQSGACGMPRALCQTGILFFFHGWLRSTAHQCPGTYCRFLSAVLSECIYYLNNFHLSFILIFISGARVRRRQSGCPTCYPITLLSYLTRLGRLLWHHRFVRVHSVREGERVCVRVCQ